MKAHPEVLLASTRHHQRHGKFSESHSTLMDIHNGDDSKLQRCDMNPVCSHFIVIEGLNHTKGLAKGLERALLNGSVGPFNIKGFP